MKGELGSFGMRLAAEREPYLVVERGVVRFDLGEHIFL
jgi:hypothetical protein